MHFVVQRSGVYHTLVWPTMYTYIITCQQSLSKCTCSAQRPLVQPIRPDKVVLQVFSLLRSVACVLMYDFLFISQDRNSFRKIVLTSAFKKRKMYEEFIDSVPILKSLEVSGR